MQITFQDKGKDLFFFVEYSIWLCLTLFQASIIWMQIDTIQYLNKSKQPYLFERDSYIVPLV